MSLKSRSHLTTNATNTDAASSTYDSPPTSSLEGSMSTMNETQVLLTPASVLAQSSPNPGHTPRKNGGGTASKKRTTRRVVRAIISDFPAESEASESENTSSTGAAAAVVTGECLFLLFHWVISNEFKLPSA